MFEKIKKNMPTGIMTVGFIISGILLVISHLTGQGTFSYESFIIGEYMREAAMVTIAECIAGAIAFKILLKKEKSSDRGFPQN